MSQQYGGPPQQPPYPPYAPYPPYPPPKKKRLGAVFWILVVGLPLMLLVGCVAVVASLSSIDPEKSTTTTQAASSPGAREAEDRGADEAAETEPTAEPESPPPSPVAKPRTYRGVGTRVLKIKPTEEPGLATINHRGGSNFVVHTVTQEGEEQDLLVNTIGDYRGTVVYNIDAGTQTSAFKITADGAWTIVLSPLALARTSAGDRLKGAGDDAVHIDPAYKGLVSVRVRHTGTSNFVVYAFHGDGEEELLINEIGRYDGEVLMPDGTFLLVIKAEGAWSMRRT
ncbi:hypothetical protein Skr01_47910 [Sphaerisporangium krabiense]|uniref:Uncharacterized protein n=1 Tax=Sphaerisporangium krabiense TaxID=763782 RepID=A0A7W8Z2D9_9ACTN|nr:hypothetical protein [Sphaerisporangium krabiense]MBB5625903.1 hypothetical protein [Sphaerisporangium krabiense]GII64706.1 hypothetical protein Skr01_47910 [Sphaerisporangium krabiense]